MAGNAVTPAKGTPGTITPQGTVTGEQLVTDAKRYLGRPYLFGGDPYVGSVSQFLSDCSGLIDRVFADLGAKLPGARPTTVELLKMGTAVPDLAHAQIGDLIFLEGGDHVGIYEGGGQMIDDPTTGQVVHEGPVYQTPYAIRRLTPTAGGGPSGGSTGAATSAGDASPSAGVALGLTNWLDSVALRVGCVIFGAVLLLVGVDMMLNVHPIAAAAKIARPI